MQEKNNKDSFKPSSIIINDNGCTFCSNNDYSFYPFEPNSLSFKTSFKRLINEKKINQNKTSIIVADSPALFIPESLFEYKAIETYYSKFAEIKKNSELFYNVSENNSKIIIYSISERIKEIKNLYLKNSNLIHYQKLIYDFLANQVKNINEKNIFANIEENYFDLFLFFGNKLQLANRFLNKNHESFLYFLFFVAEKYNLGQDDFFINFLGNYKAFIKYYDGTSLYHKNTKFVTLNNIDKTIRPSSFLVNLHAHYFRIS